MQISEVSSEGLKKVYRVTVEAADIAKETEVELKAIGKKAKIPGFRPGNVPVKVLQQRFGAGVHADVLKNVVNDATQKVVRDNQIRPAAKPDVKVEDYKEGGQLVFTLDVESLPEMPTLSFDSITLERETFAVEETELDEQLGKLAERFPHFVPDAKAKATEGSVLTIDFVGKVGGVAFDGGTAEGFKIEIGTGRLIDGFEEQLKGLKAGDEKEVSVTFPENYFSTELAGKPAVFDVKVLEVARKETPGLDDAFARERGMTDLPALREAVRGQMTREYDGMVRTRLKKRLFDALEAQCDFPLPASMVDAEFNTIWGRLQEAKRQDTEEDVYEGKSEEAIREEYRQLAERRVRLGLLLADIGTREKLQVARDELTQAVMNQARAYPGQEQTVFDFYRKNPGRLDELRGPILEEKAVDWILAKVSFTDKLVSTKELALEESD